MNETAKKDIYRYYGDGGEPFVHSLFRKPELRYIIALRKAHGSKNPFSHLRLRRLSHKTGIQIPARTKIGEGFYIGHCGRVIIHPDCVIGKNCNVGTGVTVGRENRGKRLGVPTIGDNVWIGTNAVVVGNITVGDDCLIAPLAFVNFDVPPHSIVVGNPAKIISRENATDGYIENRV